MSPLKKFSAGIAAAGALATGGTFAVDAQINPYEDIGNRLEIVAVSTIEEAGDNKVSLAKDRPAITLEKWDGEAGMTIAYDKVKGEGSRAFLTDRMEWKDGAEEVHAYPLEAKAGMEDGGFEIEVILNEKPDTNVFAFKIEGAEELNFFYQPPLTKEEIEEGSSRPENVVGSYAVYHKTKANHRIGDTNYATGKVYHIYRPKAVDADGNETWANLSYSDATLSVTVPLEWLDKATYPVRVDPTFGNTSTAATSNSIALSSKGNAFVPPQSGVVTSITFYSGTTWTGGRNFKAAIYSGNTTAALLVNPTGSSQVGAVSSWLTSTITNAPVTPGQSFILQAVGDGNNATITYDSGGADWFFNGNTTYAAWANSLGGSISTSLGLFAIYATYTDCTATCSDAFTSAGNFTWTAPTGVTSADVACWAGGGGGGDGTNAGGGGGGGGAFASSTVSVTPGVNYPVVIGSGGLGATVANAAGAKGGTSTFATTTVVAAGGNGGPGANAADSGIAAGGPTASSTGTVTYAGGNGGAGANTADIGGGGGGSAGPTGAGNPGFSGLASATGGGGSAGSGGAGGVGLATNPGVSNVLGGGGGSGAANAGKGGAGGFPGGGGGGGEGSGANGGGVGAVGQCTITYTISSGGGGGGDASSTPQSVLWFE